MRPIGQGHAASKRLCPSAIQLRGPYRWWHHEHRFERCGDGTRIIDEVEQSAPLHWISHPLIVERDVGRIFDFRTRALNRILGGPCEP